MQGLRTSAPAGAWYAVDIAPSDFIPCSSCGLASEAGWGEGRSEPHSQPTHDCHKGADAGRWGTVTRQTTGDTPDTPWLRKG